MRISICAARLSILVAVTATAGACHETSNRHDGGEGGRGGDDASSEGGSRADGGDDRDAARVDGASSDGGTPSGSDSGVQDLPIQRFAANECKRSPGELFTGRTTTEYAGLQCIAWDLRPVGSVFDLLNFPEGCGFQGFGDTTLWKGFAERLGSNTVRLSIEWDFSDPSACGMCLHDFSFETVALDIASDLELEVQTRDCLQCEWKSTSVIIPSSAQSTGILCRHLEAPYRSMLPPGSQGAPPDNGMCEAGLVAVTLQGSDEVCAIECSETDVCPVTEVFECVDSACQVSDPW